MRLSLSNLSTPPTQAAQRTEAPCSVWNEGDTFARVKGRAVTDFFRWEADLKANCAWPLQRKGERQHTTLTAVVKGAGPGGAAAAIELAKLGYSVVLVDLRTDNTRLNVVSLRAEALRRLSELGALAWLEEHKKLQPFTLSVFNEWSGKTLPPLPTPHFRDADYVPPDRLSDQSSTHLTRICDIETALLQVARNLGVRVVVDASVALRPASDTKRNGVTLIPQDTRQPAVDLGFPDLVVMAAGENDTSIESDLGISRHIGLELTPERIPTMARDTVRLEGERLERQACVMFGLVLKKGGPATEHAQDPSTMHVTVRRDLSAGTPQLVTSAFISLPAQQAYAFQLPRQIDVEDSEAVLAYTLQQLNQKLKTQFSSLQNLEEAFWVNFGSLTDVFPIQTASLDTFIHGGNTVIVGDAAGTAGPATGLGLQTAVSIDSLRVATLARVLKDRAATKAAGVALAHPTRRGALRAFNVAKAEALQMWTASSRKFFLTEVEAQRYRPR